MDDYEYFSDFPCFRPAADPEWLPLLSPEQLGWREAQFAKGRNPDDYILLQLVNAGLWRIA